MKSGEIMPEFVISSDRESMIQEFVEKLPILRKKAKLSQRQFGENVGKSRQKISDIERKTAPMGWDTYLAACTMLEMLGAFSETEDAWYFDAKQKWF